MFPQSFLQDSMIDGLLATKKLLNYLQLSQFFKNFSIILKAIIFIFLFSMSSVYAVPTGEITSIGGDVKYSKRMIKKGDTLADDGILTIGKDSFVKIYVEFWRGSFVFNENTSLAIKFWKKGEKREYNLTRGRCRWIDEKREKMKEIKGRNIHTTNAIVKILKGDIVVNYDNILKETQILVLSGRTVLQSRRDPNDRIILDKGIWAGIGGRFGNTIGEVLTFSHSEQKHFFDKKF